jgi:predicted RNA binding protein YcfA (HicA-like mRNA interferase family)
MDSRELIKRLKADGWYKVGQEGDHVQLKHPTKPGRVTVPHPVKDILDATLASIRPQSGLTLREDIRKRS